MGELAFNLILGGTVLFFLLAALAKRTFPWHIIGSFMLIALTLGLLVLEVDANGFYLMRLVCYAVFIHGSVFLILMGWILRKTYPKMALIGRVLGFLLVLVGLDAFVLEPNWLQTTHYTIKSKKVSKPILIAVLSDFQTDEIGSYEKRVLKKIIDKHPDLILLPGDYIQVYDKAQQQPVIDVFKAYLKEIEFNAPMGVYAVKGNTETLLSNWPKVFDGLPVRTITEKETIRLKELDITGLGLWESFRTSMKINRPSKDKFHLVFGHGPDFALGQVDADLLVAGHTHGGQVSIPFFGPPITLSKVPRDWAAGKTELAENKTLIVSKGTGMERGDAPRLRFLCRPELVFIHLKPE